MALAGVKKRLRVTVTGRVQGVGFRPAVFRTASELALAGRVRNSCRGVEIDVEGPPEDIDRFLELLKTRAPGRARIEKIISRPMPAADFKGFRILSSSRAASPETQISPDTALCCTCLEEINDPCCRRHLYAFTNCTQCGPRFSIIRAVPYDRAATAMSEFSMCPECAEEYLDPSSRRFHAQPNACGVCGPEVELIGPGGAVVRGTAALKAASESLAAGRIVALKGLGGFHIACAASDSRAVKKLRIKKSRKTKPFALMAGDVSAVRRHCRVSFDEEKLLSSFRSPVVLLRKKEDCELAFEIGFSNSRLGFMLPCTPLHSLLFNFLPDGFVLVMTSGNVSNEPIIHENSRAKNELSKICDLILLHNRPIISPCDDSVAVILPGSGAEYLIRRSRGWVPEPVFLNSREKAFKQDVFAAGGDLKSAFCLARGGEFILSQHIGDLSDFSTFERYAETAEHFKKLFKINPRVYACDMHPGYHSTSYVLERAGSSLIRIQHHHAHIAACMADNALGDSEKVIGVAFDGTGYGPDGSLWGGEFLICGYGGYERAGSLGEIKLPGGEKAIKEPWRIALGMLYEIYGNEFYEAAPGLAGSLGEDKFLSVKNMIDAGVNCPVSSGAGRLFDGVSALLGLCRSVSYEGEAAAALESSAAGAGGWYECPVRESGLIKIDYLPMIINMVEDMSRGVGPGEISEKFHRTLASVIVEVCILLKKKTGVAGAALSGGVFQNINLLEKTVAGLEAGGVKVYIHKKTPANDGGLSLGQAAIASWLAGGGAG